MRPVRSQNLSAHRRLVDERPASDERSVWPEAYWTIWSQAVIHRIHMRVLVHIKNLSEAGG
jgi:hypothetical protein